MGRFLLGFTLGLSIGVGMGLLLSPEPGHVNREKLRQRTDQYASGEETVIGTFRKQIDAQRHRFELALEAGRLANAKRQEELWAQLNLTPYDQHGKDVSTLPAPDES